jgi:hypothetical protein
MAAYIGRHRGNLRIINLPIERRSGRLAVVCGNALAPTSNSFGTEIAIGGAGLGIGAHDRTARQAMPRKPRTFRAGLRTSEATCSGCLILKT